MAEENTEHKKKEKCKSRIFIQTILCKFEDIVLHFHSFLLNVILTNIKHIFFSCILRIEYEVDPEYYPKICNSKTF